MKLNIADNKGTGMVKQFEITDEQLRRVPLTDYQLGSEIDGGVFGDQFKGYIFRLRGGSDKDGFPMVPGVLVPSRVSLLVKRGAIGFNTFRGRNGERRRKNVRGAIVAGDIALLNVTISKKGDNEIEGLTDTVAAKRLGPKRAGKIRKLFNLGRDADLSKVVVRRRVTKEGKKDRLKSPKIQRLITPKIKARRAKKATLMIAKVRKSAEERRAYLKTVAAERRSRRQRYHAKSHNKKVALQNAEVKAMQH
ncbi:small subunit ribosomal protein S6e [Angomonas deanei]|uniref:40S ribosomal protein S6 n=1 Tax=Angomonas deanei TaxID=59799 RepID=S9U0D0_9TRYP|nr:small subunit ribosomal protein S6e [Angomonas deanei]EPY38613.1 small subunit ribosomal protein S6e [Angomonas deanei]EPY40783.1 small subunit ribosomal protein S6e [Angomonas deanei]CAD2216853.1 Ribosomal protein S6e, putative [Angomonas deanei]CAD2216854.1 Ribosomal protein S6e, putative [Angomonas deanei]|eukprot:EPY24197.1 small subunit ribosomal protein S6e [Angomonas deanei]